ncbi:DUF4439 domain-containing protein [Rudaeicoccus suwonensis]|uniref:Uncharacterized protein DUF4439 n=1 Tax=Rudaeicoccus suwonensis TaxID=657409 RepID=A0A561E9I8_9MICO|nr:DUF4439 domain-containing protein [Rudaeicoccus suwonensis]TWE12279.1 uncharacterized protein DUF4439 [Rudaeicoccus suwonensis]
MTHMPDRVPPRKTSRRTLLLATVGTTALGLTGCDIRLKKNAPDIPGIAAQGPPENQAALLALLAGVRAATTNDVPTSTSWVSRLAMMHRAQLTTLEAVMASEGIAVPAASVATSAPASSTSSPTSSTSSTAVTEPTAAQLLTIEKVGLTASLLSEVSKLTTSDLPMGAAVLATRVAATRLLGSPITLAPQSTPPTTAIVAVLPNLRAAVYGLETIIAKTPENARSRAQATLTVLYAARSSYEATAAGAAPVEPPGYDLPIQPTTDAARSRLAQQLLGTLVTTIASQVGQTHHQPAQFAGLVQLWGDVTGLSWQWGSTPAAFPGLL